MKFAKLLHNPGAGGSEHTPDQLSGLIKAAGFSCSSTPVKKINGETIDADAYDFVVLAGGDGTVRKAARELLDENLPIGLLPMGTANNIAKTLSLSGSTEEIIQSWNTARLKRFDVGKIHGLHKKKKSDFFLESVGFGVFPKLMKEMRKQEVKREKSKPRKSIKTALEVLYDIVMSYKARHCKIKIDGVNYSGEYLLAEVMNTRAIGPNLFLAPFADPGDGLFDVVLIAEKHRSKFADYIMDKVNQEEKPAFFKSIKAKKIEMSWKGRTLHIDDERIEMDEPVTVTIRPVKHALEFLVPA